MVSKLQKILLFKIFFVSLQSKNKLLTTSISENVILPREYEKLKSI